MVPRIYLDANVFIVAYESGGETAGALKQVFRLIESQNAEAFTSDLTLAEVLVGPYRDGDDELAATYVHAISSVEGFRVVPIEREILVRAARLRADRRSLKLPDAIHLATAELCDCGILVSNDTDVVTRAPMSRVGFAAIELAELIDFLA